MSVSLAGVGSATFTGNNGVGSISVPGMVAGDKLVVTYTGTDYGNDYIPPGQVFEAIISVNDEVQQLVGANLSSTTCMILFMRGV